MNFTFLQLCAGIFFGCLAVAISFSPTLSLYAKHLGANEAMIGILVTVVSLTGFMLRVPGGALAQVLGKKKLLMAGGITYCLSPLVFHFADTTHMLLVGSLTFGFIALAMPAGYAVVYDMFEEPARTHNIALFNMSMGVGFTIGPYVAGWLIESTGNNYPKVFLLASASGLVAFSLIATLKIKREEKASEAGIFRSAFDNAKKMLGDRMVLSASIARMFQVMAMGTVNSFFPIYGLSIGLSPVKIGIVIAAQNFTSLFSCQLFAYLCTKTRNSILIIIGMLILPCGLVGLYSSTNYWILVAMACTLGAGFAASMTATINYVSKISGKEHFSTAMGVVGSFFDLGMLISGMIGGFLIAQIGLVGLAAVIGFVICLYCLFAFFTLDAHYRTPKAKEVIIPEPIQASTRK